MTTKTDIEQERRDFEAWFDREIKPKLTGSHHLVRSIAERGWMGRAALQSQERDVSRPVLAGIIDEIHRRADKEWADDGYDFEVTITADEYKALCEEEMAIDHARRIEGTT